MGSTVLHFRGYLPVVTKAFLCCMHTCWGCGCFTVFDHWDTAALILSLIMFTLTWLFNDFNFYVTISSKGPVLNSIFLSLFPVIFQSALLFLLLLTRYSGSFLHLVSQNCCIECKFCFITANATTYYTQWYSTTRQCDPWVWTCV